MRTALTWIVLVVLGCMAVFALGGVGPIELVIVALVAAAITWLARKRRSAAGTRTQ